MKLSLIVPTYREIGTTIDFQRKYSSLLSFLNRDDFELIYTFDGNLTDEPLMLGQYLEKNGIKNGRIIVNPTNKGKGYNTINAMKSANPESQYIGFIDFGNDLDLKCLKDLYEIISNNSYSAVFAKKEIIGNKSLSIWRKIISMGWLTIVNLVTLLWIPDSQTGCKFFKHEVFNKISPNLKENGFAFDVEIFLEMKKQGYDNWFFETVHYLRQDPTTINFKRDIIQMFISILKIKSRYP